MAMKSRPQSTPPIPEHRDTWTTAPRSAPPLTTSLHHPRRNHRHSVSNYANILPQPMYHPLQQRRGSNKLTGAPPIMRRGSSPDIKVRSLHHVSSQREEDGGQEGGRRKILRSGSFQGRGSEDGDTELPRHRRAQSVTPRNTGEGLKLQRHSVGASLTHSHPHPSSESGGSLSRSAPSSSAPVRDQVYHRRRYSESQTSWDGAGTQDSEFRKTSGSSRHSPSQEMTAVSSTGSTGVLLLNRGEAWQLEEEEEERVKRGRGSRPSGHVDEALFTTRIPRHYFHSSHPHPHSQHSQHSSQKPESDSRDPFQRWSQPTTDRYTADVGSRGPDGLNILQGGLVRDKNCPPGEAGNVLADQQQRVAEWLQEQAELALSTGAASDRSVTRGGTRSLPQSLQQREEVGANARRVHPTRTFSYIQAQVHPVNAQEAPHKGFDPQKMTEEYNHCFSDEERTPGPDRDPSPSSQPRPRPKGSPHPHRARTRSSPNIILRRDVVRQVKGQTSQPRRCSKDSIHPDKRFSTGNIPTAEDKLLGDHRHSASPVSAKESHVTSHMTSHEIDDELSSSDDTGGQRAGIPASGCPGNTS